MSTVDASKFLSNQINAGDVADAQVKLTEAFFKVADGCDLRTVMNALATVHLSLIMSLNLSTDDKIMTLATCFENMATALNETGAKHD